MKIKWGALVTDGRGKLGGHVASKNRNGSYLRTKVTPVNPQTSFQSSIRVLLAQFSAGWSNLTSAARTAFNESVQDWSKTDIFGDIKNPTGKNLYTSLNLNLANVGYPTISLPPEKQTIIPIGATGIEIDITAGEINFDSIYGDLNSKVLVSATPSLSPGVSFYKGKFRNIYFSLTGNVDIEGMYDAYVARFGVPLVGANIAFEIKQVAPNGQTTVPQIFKASVV